MDLKIIQSLLERVQIHKNAGNQIICDSLAVQDKQGTHEQLSLNRKHTAVDHLDNNTVLGIKGV